MEIKNANGLQKASLLIISLLFIGSVAYNIKQTNKSKEILKIVEVSPTEKLKIISQLEDLKVSYTDAIAEKTTISRELIIEKAKADDLIKKLKLTTNDNTALLGYKKMYLQLNEKMKILLKEVADLKSENNSLSLERDDTQKKLDNAVLLNEELESKNDILNKTVSKASKLVVMGLKANAYKQSSSGNQSETDRAKRANIMKVNFTVAENKVVKTGDKVFFIQIIDNNSNVVGDRKVINYKNSNLIYTASKIVSYKNETTTAIVDVPVVNLVSGVYFVNVFSQGELVSKTTVDLK